MARDGWGGGRGSSGWGWGGTHRGVVLGEALMEKPWAPTPSPTSWSANRHAENWSRKKSAHSNSNALIYLHSFTLISRFCRRTRKKYIKCLFLAKYEQFIMGSLYAALKKIKNKNTTTLFLFYMIWINLFLLTFIIMIVLNIFLMFTLCLIMSSPRHKALWTRFLVWKGPYL